MRILVMSAGVGSGHNRAAEALKNSCDSFENVESKWEDALNYTSRIFRSFYADSYILVTNKFPMLWGIIYQLAGNKGGERAKDVIKAVDQIAYQRVINMVNDYKPDAVICTHFLPANVILTHKGGKRSKLPVYVVITDYDAHVFWINRDATGYFVAAEEIKWLVARHDYPLDKIVVTGIPTASKFSVNSYDISLLRSKLGLRQSVPTILFTSGGYGSHHMHIAMERILRIDKDYQLLVIAGKNHSVKSEIEQLSYGDKRVKVYGFVNNMDELMKASDFIVAKSGGLTVAESLAVNIPMVIFSPTQGHEERNCDYLLENGAAIKAQSIDVLDYKIKWLLDNPDRLKLMRQKSRLASNPDASHKIVSHVINQIKAKTQ